jgi:predicted anti-sigma-YlaC factor YlaD
VSATYVCRTFVEDVTAYLEGALASEIVARVDAHLAGCPHCTVYLDQMRRTIRMSGVIGEADVDAMPADLRARLLDAFREPGA